MNDILIRSLSAAAGGMIAFLVGIWQRRIRREKYLRKALLEVVGAALVGAFLDISSLPVQCAISFFAGVAWSLLCQGIRDLLTKRIEQASTSLEAWLKSGGVPANTSPENRKFAVQWPASIWSKILHGIGLTNLSDRQIAAYETYRAQVAWDIHYSAEKDRLHKVRKDRSPTWRRWSPQRAAPLISIAVAGLVVYSLVFVFAPAATSVVQALVILLLFLWVPDPLVDVYKSPDETEAAMQFYRYWCAAQASWILLYLIRFSSAIMPHNAWEIASLFLDNVNSFFIVMCYFVLRDPPYTSSEKEPISLRLPAIGMAIVGALTAAQTLCYFSGWDRHIDYFYWISGCAGGVALALLVGRLQSESFIPPIPFLVISLLYLYVVIQGEMGAFGASEILNRISLFLALGLKCLLILVFACLVESGHLLSYMTRQRILQEEEEGTQEKLMKRWEVD